MSQPILSILNAFSEVVTSNGQSLDVGSPGEDFRWVSYRFSISKLSEADALFKLSCAPAGSRWSRIICNRKSIPWVAMGLEKLESCWVSVSVFHTSCTFLWAELIRCTVCFGAGPAVSSAPKEKSLAARWGRCRFSEGKGDKNWLKGTVAS